MRKHSSWMWNYALITFVALVLNIIQPIPRSEAVRLAPKATWNGSDFAYIAPNTSTRAIGSAVSVRYRRCLLTARHVPVQVWETFVGGNNTFTGRFQRVAGTEALMPDEGAWNDVRAVWLHNHDLTPIFDNRILLSSYRPRPLGDASDLNLTSRPIGNFANNANVSAITRGYGNSGTRLTLVSGFMIPRDYGAGYLRIGTNAKIHSYYDGFQNGNNRKGSMFAVVGDPTSSQTSHLICAGDSGGPFAVGQANTDPVYGINAQGFDEFRGPLTSDQGGIGEGAYCGPHVFGGQNRRGAILNYATAFNFHDGETTAESGNYQQVLRLIERTCGVTARTSIDGQGTVTGSVSQGSADPYADDLALNDAITCPANVNEDCSETLHDGETLNLVATPAAGWTFSHWSDGPFLWMGEDDRPVDRCVCNGSTSTSCSIPMDDVGYYDENISYDQSTCVAHFKPDYCGDGIIEAGEECDTGMQSATCDFDCTTATCGDSYINSSAGETCDDGNTTNGDGCSSTCTLEQNYCGNAVVDAGEECDAGQGTGTGMASPECNADCTLSECGDGIENSVAGETCDDSNTTNGDGCSSSCRIEECGNSIIDGGEQCDGGTSGNSTCDSNCTVATCGDGTVNGAAGETCDDSNTVDGDGCSSACIEEEGICGDGNVDPEEFCDDGYDTDSCDNDCTAPMCGDGHWNFADGEECDDQNLMNGDGCSSTCILENSALCGNGIVEYGEQCDDGNTTNSDGCDAQCAYEPSVCGNNVIEGAEQCDDGNAVAGDGCSSICLLEQCGNNIVEGTEQCDDGNTANGDGCSATCQEEAGGVCGNGITEWNEQCDDGNTANGDGCSAICHVESSSSSSISSSSSSPGPGCSDPDNNANNMQILTQGTMVIGNLSFTDFCPYQGTGEENNPAFQYIREYQCPQSMEGLEEWEYQSQYFDYPCPGGMPCSNGACQPQSCTDTDPSNDTSVVGSLTYGGIFGGTYSDTCFGGSMTDPTKVVEYDCYQNTSGQNPFVINGVPQPWTFPVVKSCPTGTSCSGGRCI